MNFAGWNDEEIKRWLWLRAVEWAGLPAFVSQPLVPVLFIFFPWYWVLGAVVMLGVLWCPIRYLFVNVAVATFACLIVAWLKWPAAAGSAIYLFLHNQPLSAIFALLWPLLSGFVGIPGKVGIIELAFAKKIGFIPPDSQL
ncbi:hypothetical protein [Geobacter sp.]|uniref:hypothetical protein n=1 Tax=Geobacter sp. TaxID=46610 RepID=UPI0026301372|nr:hypothetical protein [Geobacter sp.]